MIDLLSAKKTLPIGVDIGHQSIKMIQLAGRGGSYDILAACKVDVDPAACVKPDSRRDFVVSAVKEILNDGDFHGSSAVIGIPNDDVRITSIRVTDSETEDMNQVINKDLYERFDLDPQEDSIKYIYAGDVKEAEQLKKELVLFGTSSDVVNENITILESAGLVPVAIEPVPAALFRSVDSLLKQDSDPDQTLVVVDVGSSYTTIVLGRYGEIGFVKALRTGTSEFASEIAKRLDVSPDQAAVLRRSMLDGAGNAAAAGPGRVYDISVDQALMDAVRSVAERIAKEIALCLRYYTVTFRGKRVEKIVLSGGGAYEDHMADVIGGRLAVDVEPARFSAKLSLTEQVCDDENPLSEWAAALGLSLYGNK